MWNCPEKLTWHLHDRPLGPAPAPADRRRQLRGPTPLLSCCRRPGGKARLPTCASVRLPAWRLCLLSAPMATGKRTWLCGEAPQPSQPDSQ